MFVLAAWLAAPAFAAVLVDTEWVAPDQSDGGIPELAPPRFGVHAAMEAIQSERYQARQDELQGIVLPRPVGSELAHGPGDASRLRRLLRAVRDEPFDVGHRIRLGDAYAHAGALDRAVHQWWLAARLDIANPSVLSRWAFGTWLHGDWETGLAFLDVDAATIDVDKRTDWFDEAMRLYAGTMDVARAANQWIAHFEREDGAGLRTLLEREADDLWVGHLLWRAAHPTVPLAERPEHVRSAFVLRPLDLNVIQRLQADYGRLGDHAVVERLAVYAAYVQEDSVVEAGRDAALEVEEEDPEGWAAALDEVRTWGDAGRFDQAERVIWDWLNTYPADAEALHLLGQIYFAWEKAEWAAVTYIYLLQLDPHEPDYAMNASVAFTQMEQPERALQQLVDFVEGGGRYHDGVMMNLTTIAGQLQDFDSSYRYARYWAEQSPDNPRALLTWAHILFYLEQWEKSYAVAEQAHRVIPTGVAPLRYMAEIAVRKGDIERAKAHIDAIRRLIPAEQFDAMKAAGQLPQL